LRPRNDSSRRNIQSSSHGKAITRDKRMEQTLHERRRAIWMLVAAAFLWSLGGMLIKLVEWNPLAIAGMRSAISALLFLIFLRRPKFTWSAVQIAAAVAYAGTVIAFVVANKLTTAANAILLQYTAPKSAM
jgi:drug/metabolite transporter (DMT)-like permease